MGDSLVDPMTDLLTTSITDPMNIFSEENKYFLKAYCLVMTMTETKTYKKNTNTKTRHRQSASKTQCMLYYSKAGVQGFEILYWLSSCDDKDKDKETNLCILGVNIFQG